MVGRKGIYWARAKGHIPQNLFLCSRWSSVSPSRSPLSLPSWPTSQAPKASQKNSTHIFCLFFTTTERSDDRSRVPPPSDLSKRDDAPSLLPPHLGPRLASPRLRSLALGARDVCSEDSFVSHKFLKCVYFVGIDRALWYVAPSFKLTSLRVR